MPPCKFVPLTQGPQEVMPWCSSSYEQGLMTLTVTGIEPASHGEPAMRLPLTYTANRPFFLLPAGPAVLEVSGVDPEPVGFPLKPLTIPIPWDPHFHATYDWPVVVSRSYERPYRFTFHASMATDCSIHHIVWYVKYYSPSPVSAHPVRCSCVHRCRLCQGRLSGERTLDRSSCPPQVEREW